MNEASIDTGVALLTVQLATIGQRPDLVQRLSGDQRQTIAELCRQCIAALAPSDPSLPALGGDSFVDLVASMRLAQRAYFAAPRDDLAKVQHLQTARGLEVKVDTALYKNRNQAKLEL